MNTCFSASRCRLHARSRQPAAPKATHLPGGPAQPGDDVLDVVDELLLLRLWVGIVKAQVAAAAVLLRDAEVHKHGLQARCSILEVC